MKKEVDITISAAVPGNRQLASNLGSLVGQQYFTVDKKNCWQGGDEGWKRAEDAVRTGASTALIPNRPIFKYGVRKEDILSAQFYKQPVTGDVGIVLNLDSEGNYDMFFPLDDPNQAIRMGKGTAEAIDAALKGTGQNFFLNGEFVVNVINQANRKNLQDIRALKDILAKIEQNILACISDNERRGKEASKEWNDSHIDVTSLKDVLSGKSNAIVIDQETEE